MLWKLYWYRSADLYLKLGWKIHFFCLLFISLFTWVSRSLFFSLIVLFACCVYRVSVKKKINITGKNYYVKKTISSTVFYLFKAGCFLFFRRRRKWRYQRRRAEYCQWTQYWPEWWKFYGFWSRGIKFGKWSEYSLMLKSHFYKTIRSFLDYAEMYIEMLRVHMLLENNSQICLLILMSRGYSKLLNPKSKRCLISWLCKSRPVAQNKNCSGKKHSSWCFTRIFI